MISKELHPNLPAGIPIQLDGDVYELDMTRFINAHTSNLRDIPAVDFSTYLFNIVKFHIGQQFVLLDEEQFMSNLREFYLDAATKVEQSRLWFVQFLLVLALGKALISQTYCQEGSSPPGARFFQKAMAMFPSCTQLWKDPLLAIEAQVLTSLYLYSIDKKESAYLYVRHAIRPSLWPKCN